MHRNKGLELFVKQMRSFSEKKYWIAQWQILTVWGLCLQRSANCRPARAGANNAALNSHSPNRHLLHYKPNYLFNRWRWGKLLNLSMKITTLDNPKTNCSRMVCEIEPGSWQGWLGWQGWQMIFCKMSAPLDDHLQEAVLQDDNLQEVGSSR